MSYSQNGLAIFSKTLNNTGKQLWPLMDVVRRTMLSFSWRSGKILLGESFAAKLIQQHKLSCYVKQLLSVAFRAIWFEPIIQHVGRNSERKYWEVVLSDR